MHGLRWARSPITIMRKRARLKRILAKIIKSKRPRASAEFADVAGVDGRDAKRARTRGKWPDSAFQRPDGFMTLLSRLHEPPLNAMVLRYLGKQAVAACCRSWREWASVGGRRVCSHLNDGRGWPYAPLDRVALALVDVIDLCRDGRESVEERAQAITSCRRATTLRANYAFLTGVAVHLDWGLGVTPCLNLRRVRFRDCSLASTDVVQLLCCTPRLEMATFVSEQLIGLSEALAERAPRCSELRSVDFTSCQMEAADVAAALEFFPSLRVAHFQAMDLRGLRVPALPALEALSLSDCNLCSEDAADVMRQCPNIQTLLLCGNPLGGGAVSPWPHLHRLRRADFRLCELESDDEKELRDSFPAHAQVEFRTRLLDQASSLQGATGLSHGSTASHTVFDDTDSDSEAS